MQSGLKAASASIWLDWFQKAFWLHVSLWKNYLSSQLIYYLSKKFPYEVMVSITSFKSSVKPQDDQLLKYGPI